MVSDIRPLVAGNWKMNGDRDSLVQIENVGTGLNIPLINRIDVLMCPPATLIAPAAEVTQSLPVRIGAQDCHPASSGAHTGDLSAAMLSEAGAEAIIVGHSERRTDHGEDDALVRAKAAAVQGAGLLAIICIGETLEERKSGKTLDVLGRQLAGSVPDGSHSENTVVAYEPVWAIGTGMTPTTDDIGEAHQFLRKQLIERFGDQGAQMRLLYGGSVKPANAGELMQVTDVNGALVGGASLKADDFLAICAAYR